MAVQFADSKSEHSFLVKTREHAGGIHQRMVPRYLLQSSRASHVKQVNHGY
jgi:hypothetical protein